MNERHIRLICNDQQLWLTVATKPIIQQTSPIIEKSTITWNFWAHSIYNPAYKKATLTRHNTTAQAAKHVRPLQLLGTKLDNAWYGSHWNSLWDFDLWQIGNKTNKWEGSHRWDKSEQNSWFIIKNQPMSVCGLDKWDTTT